ncbi:coiled-coil and C2 domain-containing protein 2A isoform X2 [Galleria mellonella]|uniref:Coiled-coil and C2 domain-containing protein 2A isoform X2 n=1 Tax=Galleria mellonella TaxID=7137 RepID=A0A6J1X0M2_GALME|nr:coiled-coil and C2 domain-containing protein 2A isoform X2 [Galleria mellonella]
MSENIELYSFCINSTSNNSDIEEYHEISQKDKIDVVPEYLSKTLKHYDFFTQFDINAVNQNTENRKKSKKRDKTKNIMDIISLELASTAVPISNNIMTVVDNIAEQQSNCLINIPWTQKIFKRFIPPYLDTEYGWGHKSSMAVLSPVFPRVLDNAITNANIPVQYIEPTMFKNFISNNIHDSKLTPKFLDISIKNIKFKHHHKFSLEKLLSVKLVDTYNDYIAKQQLIDELMRDIKVNRETRDNLKQDLLRVSPNKKEDIRFDETVRKYTDKLLKAKAKYLETLKMRKQLIHNIIVLWSDIEMIRDKTGTITTPFILHIATKTLDGKKYEEEWDRVFNIEFTDLLCKMEYEYVSKYIEYKEMKKDQNVEYSRRKSLSKPKLEVDQEVLKEEAEEIVNTVLMREAIEVNLKTDDSILSNKKLEKNQLLYNYCFTIFIDDVFVCESEQSVSQNLSSIEINETFSVQIIPNNKTLTIVLSENSEDVAYIKKNLSDIKKSYVHSDFVIEYFVYKNIVEPNTKIVGSGFNIKDIAKQNKMRLKSSNNFEGKLYTNCETNLRIGWNEKLSNSNSEHINSSMDIGRQLKRLMHGIDKPNIDLLVDIISKIYGKDVEGDDKIMSMLRNICKSNLKGDEAFPFPKESSPEYVRLKLLHLRNVGGFSNIENKLIPLHGSQISTEQLNCLQMSDDKDFDIEYIHSKNVDRDPIEMERFIGAKYVQKLNKNLLININEHLLKKTHKDVVRDFKNFGFRSFFSSETKFTALTTISSSTKQQFLNESLCKEQELQVTVLRAFNLLDRKDTILNEDDETDDKIAGYKVRPLRPFVRVSYHGTLAQTATAIGCHPTWNQTVIIKARPDPLSSIYINIYDEYKANIDKGYSEEQGTSQTVHYRYYNKWLGTLHVPLYAVLTMGVLRGTFKINSPPAIFGYESLSRTKESTQSLIPEVTQLMNKDTSYISLQITTNLSHLGGLQMYNQPIPSSPDDDYLIKHLNNFVTEYLNDFPSRTLSLTFVDSSGRNKCVTQFLQPIPLPDYEFFPKNPKNRSGSAVSKSSGFSKSSSSRSSGGRKEDDRGSNQTINEERESIYGTRDGSWRSGDSQLTRLINASVRYVALIPTYEITEPHVVTLLGVELLKVLYGSPIDHSILLASYFLYLGIKCWVAIGVGLPRGRTSYVLTKYDTTSRRIVLSNDQLFKKGLLDRTDGYLWYVHDATSGERYELRDVSCPLKTVDYVFDNENIWVNVQTCQDCESVSFDFTKSSNWQPVFDKRIFVMKQPIVNDPALYSAPADVARLREALELKIRSKVQKWRPHMKTIWNRYCSGLLRELLPSWEYWTFNPAETKPGFSQRMKQLMVTYKIYGFPLNMAYANAKSVVSCVKSTGVHVDDDPNAEFGLAVDVYAYPNNVLSVWVFLASITRI